MVLITTFFKKINMGVTMSEVCRICGDSEIFLQNKGAQVGVYCANCGKWIKWLSKKDQAIYKNKGYKVYPQNVEVKLKGNAARGVSLTPITNDMGLESSVPLPSTTYTEKPRAEDNSKLQNNLDSKQIEEYIEAEVNKRVQDYIEKSKSQANGVVEDIGYCPVCDGSPLASDNINNVEVSIFSGTLSVTNKEGTQILGLYKLKRCPNCGRIF